MLLDVTFRAMANISSAHHFLGCINYIPLIHSFVGKCHLKSHLKCHLFKMSLSFVNATLMFLVEQLQSFYSKSILFLTLFNFSASDATQTTPYKIIIIMIIIIILIIVIIIE